MSFSLKILTYNLHKGFSALGSSFQLETMQQALLAEAPDILFLQEVQGAHLKHQTRIKNWPAVPQLEYLGGENWPFQAYGQNVTYKNGHHGNGLLSNLPLIEWEQISIAASSLSKRGLLHAKIQRPGTTEIIHLICVHLGLSEGEREKQLGLISARIASHVPSHEPLILAGDFNDWRKRAEKHLAKNLSLKDAFLEQKGKHPKTFPAVYPVLSLDRIYYRGLKLVSCECLRSKQWRGLSDHLPLTATFEMV
jgi:endonuclease/exonuclease/phosphatase family metal-dependent hydrolase